MSAADKRSISMQKLLSMNDDALAEVVEHARTIREARSEVARACIHEQPDSDQLAEIDAFDRELARRQEEDRLREDAIRDECCVRHRSIVVARMRRISGEYIKVIELEPILDLLSFYIGQPSENYTMYEDADRDTKSILLEHGRL